MKDPIVKWLKEPESTKASCLICKNSHNNKIILEALHWNKNYGFLKVASCSECKSAWFIDAEKRNIPYPSTEDTLKDDNFIYLIYHYLELVNGLDWKVYLLEKIMHKNINSILEVGCNVGVTIDYCKTVWGVKESIGVEPSAYGVLGSHALDLKIFNKYLKDIDEIKDKKFDFIFATEVLEHVIDPLSFLNQLHNFMSEEGILLITTPRASSLNTHTPPGELYAALSPGAHYFLLSSDRLQKIGYEAGFNYSYIEPFGITNILILSNKEIQLDTEIKNTSELILNYYEKKAILPFNDERVLLSFLINSVIYKVKCNHKIDSHLTNKINKILAKKFNITTNKIRSLSINIEQCNSIFDIGKIIPYSLPFYLYSLSLDDNINSLTKQCYLSLARLIILKALSIDFQNFFVYVQLLEKIEHLIDSNIKSKIISGINTKSSLIKDTIPEFNKTEKTWLKKLVERFYLRFV